MSSLESEYCFDPLYQATQIGARTKLAAVCCRFVGNRRQPTYYLTADGLCATESKGRLFSSVRFAVQFVGMNLQKSQRTSFTSCGQCDVLSVSAGRCAHLLADAIDSEGISRISQQQRQLPRTPPHPLCNSTASQQEDNTQSYQLFITVLTAISTSIGTGLHSSVSGSLALSLCTSNCVSFSRLRDFKLLHRHPNADEPLLALCYQLTVMISMMRIKLRRVLRKPKVQMMITFSPRCEDRRPGSISELSGQAQAVVAMCTSTEATLSHVAITISPAAVKRTSVTSSVIMSARPG